MSINPEHIFIFKTNVQTDLDRLLLHRTLHEVAGIESWTVDMKDIDRVLRVISYSLRTDNIIHLVNSAGFQCAELI